jgi:uncharacterized Zn finger protein
MSEKKTTVADLLSHEIIREMARASDLRYGRAIYRRGGVAFIEYGPREVEGWVGGLDGSVREGGSQRRHTRLFVRSGKLGWHCAGNPRNHQIFCKHCVALALAVLARSSKL